MSITKSIANDIEVLSANGLSVFVDDNDEVLKLKDTNGFVEPVSNYLGSGLLENIGGETEIYVDGTTAPSQLRTLKAGANISFAVGDTIEVSAANATGTALYYGSFYDTTTQTTTGGEQKAMTLNTTALTNGVSIVSNSRITVANTGIYNLQFSAQIIKTQGGQSADLYIYLRKNGVNIPETNTRITLANNGHYMVVAWNFVESLVANQYLELMWYATDQHIQIARVSNVPASIPMVPSLIVTMNRVG